jgi:hypothetical protein
MGCNNSKQIDTTPAKNTTTLGTVLKNAHTIKITAAVGSSSPQPSYSIGQRKLDYQPPIFVNEYQQQEIKSQHCNGQHYHYLLQNLCRITIFLI